MRNKIYIILAVVAIFLFAWNVSADEWFFIYNGWTSSTDFYNTNTNTKTTWLSKYWDKVVYWRVGKYTFLRWWGLWWYLYNEETNTLSSKYNSSDNLEYWNYPSIIWTDDLQYAFIPTQYQVSPYPIQIIKIKLSDLTQTRYNLGASQIPNLYKYYNWKIYYRVYWEDDLLSIDISNGNISTVIANNSLITNSLDGNNCVQNSAVLSCIYDSENKLTTIDLLNGTITQASIILPSYRFITWFIKDYYWNYFFINFRDWIWKLTNFSTFAYSLYESSTNIAINPRVSSYIPPLPPETCTDWIINQNETETDYGWVCWTCSDWIQQTSVTNPETSVDLWGRCGTCSDAIQNPHSNETGVDTGGRCGNQICSYQEVNRKYANPSYYTGSYLSQTRQYFNSWSVITDGKDYVEVITPPSSHVGYKFEETEYTLHGAYITSQSGTLAGLGNNNLEITVPWYIQSPIDYSNFIGESYISAKWVYPMDYVQIWGTGSTASGSFDNENSADFSKPWYGCAWLENELGQRIGAWDKCYWVGPLSTAYQYTITNLIKMDKQGKYTIRIGFPSNALDKHYIISRFNFWNLVDQQIQQYICVNNDTGDVTADWAPISWDTYNEITGSGDIQREQIASGSVTQTIDFSFGTLPSVGSGTDCKNMFNSSSGTFLYWSAGAKLIVWNQNNFKITPEPWTCPLIGIDACSVIWGALNSGVWTIYWLQNRGISAILDPINSGLAYLGTPKSGQHYCFATLNLTYVGRPTSYLDTKGVTHTLGENEQTLFDYTILCFLAAGVTYILLKF